MLDENTYYEREYAFNNNEDGYVPRDYHNIDFDECPFSAEEFLKACESKGQMIIDSVKDGERPSLYTHAFKQVMGFFDEYYDKLNDAEFQDYIDHSKTFSEMIIGYMMQDEDFLQVVFEELYYA